MWQSGNMGIHRTQILATGYSLFLFLCFFWVSWVGAVTPGLEIQRIRYFIGPDHTRVVLDLSGPSSFEVREVRDPARIAINVRQARFRDLDPMAVEGDLVRRIRKNRGRNRAQVVLDLTGLSRLKSFSLPAGNGRPDRIVVDIFPAGSPATSAQPKWNQTPSTGRIASKRPFTVIIDPGHGGIDPGAIGPGIQEKFVVFDISREMARLINQVPGYRAVLTRKTDYYPNLGRRVEIASEEDGDLFLSIHCNTHRKSSVSGMEVYFLSLQGATDREARELADKENAADMVGLDPKGHHPDMVMNILMDLRMTQVLHESGRLAEGLLSVTKASGLIGGRKVKQARFQVLRSLAMPSALVEVGYLTNQKDLALIKSPSWRRKMASNLVEGILKWRRDEPAIASLGLEPSNTWTRQYRVARGDSLWKLARNNRTTVGEISRRNNLRTQAIVVGQLLRLPEVHNVQ
ncbi:MAG: N-acetylmuramoyl-L-alanine amidase [Gemmatimonadales bacterium]|nr:N-acetylmuramoyl-L-alanine amidase [Gemmatimonadales bacterium]